MNGTARPHVTAYTRRRPECITGRWARRGSLSQRILRQWLAASRVDAFLADPAEVTSSPGTAHEVGWSGGFQPRVYRMTV